MPKKTKKEKEYLHVVFHTYEYGHDINLFKNKKSADIFMTVILKEYSDKYGEKVTSKNLHEFDDRCNLECFKQEIE
jgi:hypothetical protein